MVTRKVKEKNISDYLVVEGFKEIEAKDEKPSWYNKASENPSCLSEIDKSTIGIKSLYTKIS
ncbi:MAG: hypothetical protein H7844_08010 [Nitrospirae bacterium YQR-1]